MAFELLKAIFSHLYAGQATDPHQAVGGITSANVHRTLSLANDGSLNATVVAGGGTTLPADDSVFTPGTSTVTPIAGFADDTGPDSVDEGDVGAVRMSLNRNLNVRIRDDAGNERGLNISAQGAASVAGTAADDAAATGNPVRVGGVYSSSLPTLTDGDVADVLLDSSSRPLVAWGQRLDSTNDGVNTLGTLATYQAGFAVVGAASGDVVEIIGSATTIVRILAVTISKASVSTLFTMVKRSAAATGGTSGNATLVPLDSGNAAATAVIKNYSADPTEGAAVGTIYRQTLATTDVVTIDFANSNGQPVVLRGVAQTLCINVGAATNFDCIIAFIEQAAL